MSKVVEMLPIDKRDLIQGLENLAGRIKNGEIVAYFIVGLGPQDNLHPMWGACGTGVSALRGIGAIEALRNRFVSQIDWGDTK